MKSPRMNYFLLLSAGLEVGKQFFDLYPSAFFRTPNGSAAPQFKTTNIYGNTIRSNSKHGIRQVTSVLGFFLLESFYITCQLFVLRPKFSLPKEKENSNFKATLTLTVYTCIYCKICLLL